MPADDVLPWKLLLSTLRRSDDSRVSYDEVLRVGAQPELLVVRERVLQYGKADDYDPPGCLHGCTPGVNYDLRASEKLVAVSCPQEPPCWEGYRFVTHAEVEGLRCRSKDVFAKLAVLNGLSPLAAKVPAPFLGVGLTRRRGLNIAVVWLRAPKLGFEQLCRGLRADLGVDGLVVLVARKPPTSFTVADKIVAFELDLDTQGHMPLVRAIEELTPDYRTRVLDDPMLDLDFVRLRFSTIPGKRHMVEINGQDFGGFRKSDRKFLALLLLATARKFGPDDGWLDKSRLRDGSDKDPTLNGIRKDLSSYDLYGLGEAERVALVRVQRGGLIRLGVPPENITLDDSLAELTFVAPTTTTKKDGTKGKTTKKQDEGLDNAGTLLRDCRRMGAPGEVDDPKTASATRRRTRSAP